MSENTITLDWEERTDLLWKIKGIHSDKQFNGLGWRQIFDVIDVGVFGEFDGTYLVVNFNSEEDKAYFMMMYL